jgi:TnpA family transposase
MTWTKTVADHDPRRRDQLGLTKMANRAPARPTLLAWLQAWHIRDETYGAALAELVNAQFRHPFAEHWGDGTTSSSDGQNFRTGSKAESTGHINRNTAAAQGGRSTPISPTSTRRSTPRS